MHFAEDDLSQFTGSDGRPRVVHIWAPPTPRAVIVAIHGGMTHAGNYQTPALFFKKQGLATVSFDLVGHQRQVRVDIPSFDVFLKDMVLFLDWVEARYPQLPILVMGHSMGGLIATHLELKNLLNRPSIKGVVLSSPYYVNAIPVAWILEKAAKLLAWALPTAKVPLPEVTDQLTHDADITARHRMEEQEGFRAREASFRFANALLQAQAELHGDLSAWKHPVFAVLAGQDRLANTQASQTWLSTIPQGLLHCQLQPDNFHENFNELNRETTFNDILKWACNEQILGV
jgi:alpha-beta hydrolase superfamily lysophospholipase